MIEQPHWPQRTLSPTGIRVGPCAWRVSMLANAEAGYVVQRPSLVMVDPEDGPELLGRAASRLRDWPAPRPPIMLTVSEPPFARQLRDAVLQRIDQLGVDRVDVLTLRVEDPQELKGGGMLQTLFNLRSQGVVAEIGLAHGDVRAAEWLAIHSAARVLVVDYSIENQAARYRLIDTAREYGMALVALRQPTDGPAALRFALGQWQCVLPVMDRALPPGLQPMGRDEIEACWQSYCATHPAPEPLPRSTPPEFA